MEQAKSVMYAIKNDGYIERPPVLMSEWIAKTVQQNMTRLPFASFFHNDAVLVPVPRSTLMQPNTLWMPERIATALVKKKIGGMVLTCLARASPLRKAAWSDPSDRPSPSEQYNTISVQGRVSSFPSEVVLVDDIITRGATMLGAANRVAEAFPNARIHAFAAMRAISDPSDFNAMYDPRRGKIEYREESDDSLRRP